MYGAAAWTLRKEGQIFLENFEKSSWRRMETTVWTDRFRKEVIGKFIEERHILHAVSVSNRICIGHILHRNCLLKHVIERKIGRKLEAKGRGRRRRKQLLNDLKAALDRSLWRTYLGRETCRKAICRRNSLSQGPR